MKYFKHKKGVTKREDPRKVKGIPNFFTVLNKKLIVTPNWKIFKLLSFFLPDYYPCLVVGVLGQCLSSVRAGFLTNLKVVIYEAIY